MQISRRILLACVVATILLPNFIQAQEDTDEQRKAREALERAMQALPAEPAPQTPAPKVTAPEKKTKTAPAKAKKEPAKKEPVFQEAAPAAPTAPAAPAVITTAPAKPAAPVTSVEPATQPIEPAPATSNAQFQPLPETQSNAAAEQKANEALSERMKEIEKRPETSEATAAPATEPAKKAEKAEKPAIRSKGTSAFPTLQVPATGLSATKEDRLKALLDDYKADKLTPEQYHAQRAKILAEP